MFLELTGLVFETAPESTQRTQYLQSISLKGHTDEKLNLIDEYMPLEFRNKSY